MIVVVMGVTGCGKTTVGELLAAEIGGVFLDADSLHPPENIERMSAGLPLTDADREPWLGRVRAAMEEARGNDETLVLACSALKAAYRDFLGSGLPDVRFVYLKGSRDQIAERIAGRSGHFMPGALLATQFADLEEPTEEEAEFVSIDRPPVEIVKEIRRALGR